MILLCEHLSFFLSTQTPCLAMNSEWHCFLFSTISSHLEMEKIEKKHIHVDLFCNISIDMSNSSITGCGSGSGLLSFPNISMKYIQETKCLSSWTSEQHRRYTNTVLMVRMRTLYISSNNLDVPDVSF